MPIYPPMGEKRKARKLTPETVGIQREIAAEDENVATGSGPEAWVETDPLTGERYVVYRNAVLSDVHEGLRLSTVENDPQSRSRPREERRPTDNALHRRIGPNR